MAISILHPGQSGSGAEPISERMPYRLSLDRSLSYICADVRKCKYFLSVVSELTDDPDEILYRQEILKDFENNPDLLDRLLSLSRRFDELRASQRNAGKDEYRMNAQKTASPEASKNILQTQSLFLKRALLFVKAYGELLANAEIRSRGLQNLHAACKEISENPEFARLIAFCSEYENFGLNGSRNFRFTLNGEGLLENCELVDRRYIRLTDPDTKKGFRLFGKTSETVYPCERIGPVRDDFFEKLATLAISDLSAVFATISGQIFKKFGSFGDEQVFYEVALRYIDTLTEKKVPVVYPTFSEHRSVEVKSLYDLYLLLSKPDPAQVVPNDFVLRPNDGGILVFGNNGSGKTVYLRSIGSMQILAQAGLPIPCESAELFPFSQLATQFSESEKEFCAGNDAGRFEQEVRELAAMVDTLKEGALVFLNETFQSTSRAEGSEGLYHLLKYFCARNIRWISVSHLRQSESRFDDGEVSVLKTREGYKIGK